MIGTPIELIGNPSYLQPKPPKKQQLHNWLLLAILFLLPLQTRLITELGFIGDAPFEFTTRAFYLIEVLVVVAALFSPLHKRKLTGAFLLLVFLAWSTITLFTGIDHTSSTLIHLAFTGLFAIQLLGSSLNFRQIGSRCFSNRSGRRTDPSGVRFSSPPQHRSWIFYCHPSHYARAAAH